MAKKPKIPKERNYAAMLVRDPNGPYRPKAVPSKKCKEKIIPRKRKHKGKFDE